MPEDNTLTLDHDGEHDMAFPEHSEHGILQAALSGLAAATANQAELNQQRASQTAHDASAMWSIAMTTPTVTAAHGMRVANESGAGRTRVESNTPAGSQTIGGGD